MNSNLPMESNDELTMDCLTRGTTRRELALCALYLCRKLRRPYSDMKLTTEGRFQNPQRLNKYSEADCVTAR